MSYSDAIFTPKVVTFAVLGDGPKLSFKDTRHGGVLVELGDRKIIVPAQDILNAARFLGAKDIDVKIK
jgi:hypothetical protein